MNDVVAAYRRTGKLMEKYNVVDPSLAAGGGEYPGQDGFGWTNGVLRKLLVLYRGAVVGVRLREGSRGVTGFRLFARISSRAVSRLPMAHLFRSPQRTGRRFQVPSRR